MFTKNKGKGTASKEKKNTSSIEYKIGKVSCIWIIQLFLQLIFFLWKYHAYFLSFAILFNFTQGIWWREVSYFYSDAWSLIVSVLKNILHHVKIFKFWSITKVNN